MINNISKTQSYTLASPLQSRCIRVAPSHSISLGKAKTNMEPAEEIFGNQSLLQKKIPRCLMLHGTQKNWTA